MPTTIDIESQRMLLGSTPVRKLYHGINLIGTRIAELFAGGVPGVWFDPSDLSTMYQDANGTIPVTGVGQPVGLMLDKSRGGRGPNMTPPTDQLSGWLSPEGVALTNNESAIVATCTTNMRVSLRVANIIQPGVYEVEVDLEAGINSAASSSVRVAFSQTAAFGGALAFPSTMTSIPGTGRSQQRAIVTVTDATHRDLLIGTNASSEVQAGSWIKLHSVSVRRIDGKHASQATTTARPILTAGFPYYLQFDGVDDHLSIPSLDFSGASSAVAVIGLEKLSDAAPARPYSHGTNIGQAGAFRFLAPASPEQASLRAAVRGADGTPSETVGANDKPAPIKVVMLASYGDGESTAVRFNGSETRVAPGGPLAGLALPNARAIVGAQVVGDTTQSNFFVGRIGGLLHIGRSLSEGERRAVERFMLQ